MQFLPSFVMSPAIIAAVVQLANNIPNMQLLLQLINNGKAKLI